MVAELDAFFNALPAGVKAVVMHGAGEHFCAGLDLAELTDRSAAQGAAHSRGWHRTFERIQFGRVPVVAVLHGAVVGGGLELASTAHIRVAESSAFYALPEGQRGIFVGGGASVRVPRLIGAARMADMMFTGRVYSAKEGQVTGISTYLVPAGKGLAKGMELAGRVAGNAPATNFALMHALPRIAELGQDAGLLMESLVAGIAQSEPEAKRRMKDFLEKRAAKVKKRG
jgi:enoyl-CoA hydratase/carnithine racemase